MSSFPPNKGTMANWLWECVDEERQELQYNGEGATAAHSSWMTTVAASPMTTGRFLRSHAPGNSRTTYGFNMEDSSNNNNDDDEELVVRNTSEGKLVLRRCDSDPAMVQNPSFPLSRCGGSQGVSTPPNALRTRQEQHQQQQRQEQQHQQQQQLNTFGDLTNRCDINNHSSHGSRLIALESTDSLSVSPKVGLVDSQIDKQNNNKHYAKDQSDSTPSTTQMTTPPTTDSAESTSIWVSVLFGIINAVIVMPVLMSFGSIIYSDPAFAPYLSVLIQLTMASGIVHQLCFSTLSSLPFAVGQVQDAGLIFLSAMASYIAKYCHQYNYDDEALLATVTIGLAMATTVLGVSVYAIGKFQLAQYVQLLPTSVVGGYLAYIGWFCGISGVALMAAGNGNDTDASNSDLSLMANWTKDVWIQVMPGIVGGLFVYYAIRRFRHVAVLPVSLILLLAIFYALLGMTDTSVEEATHRGWIRGTGSGDDDNNRGAWYQTWRYFRFDRVVWSVFPHLISTEISMIAVVALSSSLDVAAIELEYQQEYGSPLNYNKELRMVGLSNIVSGLTGGYTGSYIFSQSIMTLRAGIRSRVAGFVLAACQLAIFLLPFPILSYVPNYVFGSLLTMICVDLVVEWLWSIQHRVTPAEHAIALSTFFLIQIMGVEYGILAGVFIYIILVKLGVNVGEVKTMTSLSTDTLPLSYTSMQNNQEINSDPKVYDENDPLMGAACVTNSDVGTILYRSV